MKFESKLDVSSEFFSTILQNMNAGIITCDINFNVTFSNSRMQEIYGIPKGVPSEDWELYIQIFEADGVTPLPKERLPLVRAIRGERVIDSYNVIVSKLNGSLLVKNNAHPVYDEAGVITGAMLTTEDSQDLAHTLLRFKAIFDQSPLSIQILDKSGKTVLINSAFQRLWGISDDFVKNHIFGKYNILEDEILEEAGANEPIRKAFAGETVHVPEFFYDPSTRGLEGRPRWTSGTIYPLKTASGEVNEVVIIHEDSTDKRAALNELEKMLIQNAALYKDAKSAVQLRDDFISIASHELRTPITSLQLQVEVLNSLISGIDTHPEITQVMRKFLGSTNGQLKRLTRLVDDMLDISRIDTGKLTLNVRKVNLVGIILDVLDRFKDHFESQKITAEFECKSDVYYECDPERIDQVMTNFMTNAIKYGKKKPIHVYLEENHEHVTIKIQDFGRGIKKSDQERIFKRFEQAHTSEDVSGLGLGLYINHKIIEEHAGLISVESEVGKGSIFYVKLPKK